MRKLLRFIGIIAVFFFLFQSNMAFSTKVINYKPSYYLCVAQCNNKWCTDLGCTAGCVNCQNYDYNSPQWNLASNNREACINACLLSNRWVSYNMYYPAYAKSVVINYQPGSVVSLQVGVWDAAHNLLTTQGTITNVNFYVVSMSDFVSAGSMEAVNWTSIGAGTFNSQTGFWNLAWKGQSNVQGQIPGFYIAAEILDPNAPGGKFDVLTAAIQTTTPNPNPAPTLSQCSIIIWCMVVFVLILLIIGVVFIRRRRMHRRS